MFLFLTVATKQKHGTLRSQTYKRRTQIGDIPLLWVPRSTTETCQPNEAQMFVDSEHEQPVPLRLVKTCTARVEP